MLTEPSRPAPKCPRHLNIPTPIRSPLPSSEC